MFSNNGAEEAGAREAGQTVETSVARGGGCVWACMWSLRSSALLQPPVQAVLEATCPSQEGV